MTKTTRTLFDFKTIIFNHRIAQDFVAGVVDLFPRDLTVCSGQLDFQIFSDVHRADFSITHVGKRALHSFSLWIQYSFLWSDNYFRFHRLTNVEAPFLMNPDIFQPRLYATF